MRVTVNWRLLLSAPAVRAGLSVPGVKQLARADISGPRKGATFFSLANPADLPSFPPRDCAEIPRRAFRLVAGPDWNVSGVTNVIRFSRRVRTPRQATDHTAGQRISRSGGEVLPRSPFEAPCIPSMRAVKPAWPSSDTQAYNENE